MFDIPGRYEFFLHTGAEPYSLGVEVIQSSADLGESLTKWLVKYRWEWPVSFRRLIEGGEVA